VIINAKKHLVTFDEAITCFYDPQQVAFYDSDHSENGRKVIMKPEYDLKKMKVKRRGVLPAFRAKTEDHTKERITILLDKDVIKYFKSKAKHPGEFPYQTQINQALRNLITQSRGGSDDIDEIKTTLLNDKDFINQLAKLIKKRHSN
jgi:uncharacterized protein (DUF4415 family)